MKLKSGFLMKKIAGENVLMFLDTSLKNKMITLNESGAFLFQNISEGKDRAALVAAMLEEYDVDEATAARDVDAFVETLRSVGALED